MPESSPNFTSDHITCPAIIELDIDILSNIFAVNADMGQDTESYIPALRTLRYTSQVCSNWRALTTGSPLLWARVVNIDELAQKTDTWRNEVIRRTRTAPLHIQAFTRNFRIWVFLRNILYENWNRVQSLVLSFGGIFLPGTRGIWSSIFQRPAPLLQSFTFNWLTPPPDSDLSSAGFVLFSNQAPSLSELDVVGMKLDLISLSAPNLRRLVLHELTTASNLLQVLSQMPLLEELTWSTEFPIIQGEIISTSVPQVILPHLRYINISECNTTDVTLSFLGHITPARDCILHYSTYFARQDNVGLLRDTFSTYLGYCTDLGSVADLSLRVSLFYFVLSLCFPSKPSFMFGTNNGGLTLPGHTIPTLLPSLTTLLPYKIKRLELYIDLTEPLQPAIVEFVHALISVEELTTNDTSLAALRGIQSITNVATLPALKIIHLDHSFELKEMAGFIDARIELGIAAETLTVTLQSSTRVDAGPLMKIYPGLRMQLRDQENSHFST